MFHTTAGTQDRKRGSNTRYRVGALAMAPVRVNATGMKVVRPPQTDYAYQPYYMSDDEFPDELGFSFKRTLRKVKKPFKKIEQKVVRPVVGFHKGVVSQMTFGLIKPKDLGSKEGSRSMKFAKIGRKVTGAAQIAAAAAGAAIVGGPMIGAVGTKIIGGAKYLVDAAGRILGPADGGVIQERMPSPDFPSGPEPTTPWPMPDRMPGGGGGFGPGDMTVPEQMQIDPETGQPITKASAMDLGALIKNPIVMLGGGLIAYRMMYGQKSKKRRR